MAERPEAPWTMPEWMEPYRELIGNTGGNPIEELYNDRTTAQQNLIRAALALSVRDQVNLLYRLQRQGFLAPTTPRSPARCEHRAIKGTGHGTCDRLLDQHGQCDRASSHA
jgi:hypothetical protein